MTGTPNRARRPTHPGAVLRNTVLPALKMPVADAADALGITRQTLHRIVSEKASITPDMAVRLGKFCGNGPELWLGMQQAVDLWDARRRLAKAVEKIPTPEVAA
ncbi:MAG: HigA family addiction module antitoxin [Parvibaculaceae bacterium]